MTELVTIEHANSYMVFVRGTPYAKKTLLPHVRRADRFEYLLGETKPNFPLPAIPLACAILPDLVQIAEVFWLDDWLETQGTLPIQKAEFELVAEFEKD